VVEEFRTRLNFLRTLACKNWCQDRETLLTTFKSLIGSVMHYAFSVWYPNTSVIATRKMLVI